MIKKYKALLKQRKKAKARREKFLSYFVQNEILQKSKATGQGR